MFLVQFWPIPAALCAFSTVLHARYSRRLSKKPAKRLGTAPQAYPGGIDRASQPLPFGVLEPSGEGDEKATGFVVGSADPIEFG